MGSTNNSRQLQFDSDGHGGIRDGKENMVGQAIYRGVDMLCPISTSSALAIAEQPELRFVQLCSPGKLDQAIRRSRRSLHHKQQRANSASFCRSYILNALRVKQL